MPPPSQRALWERDRPKVQVSFHSFHDAEPPQGPMHSPFFLVEGSHNTVFVIVSASVARVLKAHVATVLYNGARNGYGSAYEFVRSINLSL